MTYRSKILTLCALIGFFSIIFVLGIFLLPHGPYARRDRAAVKNFDPDQVHRIEIEVPVGNSAAIAGGEGRGRDIVLVTAETAGAQGAAVAEGDWHYLLGNEYVPVRDDRVETLLDSVSQLQRYRSVTSNVDLHSELGVTADRTANVRLYDAQSQPILDLAQGNLDQQRGVYVRFDNSDTVDLISSELIFYLEQQPGYWQQTDLFPADIQVSDVTSITVSVDNITLGIDEQPISAQYRLVRTFSADSGGSLWQISGSETTTLDQLQVDNLASAILILEADSFTADRAEQIDFTADVRARIIIELSNGALYFIDIAERDIESGSYILRIDGPQVLTRADGSDYLYHVNNFSLRPLIKTLPSLFPPSEEEAVDINQLP